jgi:drug/metabolite transporter (DMT)-like permease
MKSSLALTVAAVVLVSCGQGLVGVFAKWIAWPPLALACGRCLVAALILWPLVMLRSRFRKNDASRLVGESNLQKRKRRTLLLSGLLLAAHWSALFSAFHIAPVGPVVIAVFTYPLMAALFEPYFFRARPERREIWAALVSLCGVVAVIWPTEGHLDAAVVSGVGLGLFSAATFAARGIASRALLAQVDPLLIVAVQVSIVAVLLSPSLMQLPKVNPRDIILIVALGTMLTALPHTVFVWAFRRLSVATSGVLGSLEVISGLFFAALLLGERHTPGMWLGAALVISAVVTRSRALLKPPTQSDTRPGAENDR